MDTGGDEEGVGLAASISVRITAPQLHGNEKKYINECLDTGFLTHYGRFEREFEDAFGKRFGRPALATSSGTAALHLSLLALGVQLGDDVLVPALCFGAAPAVILAVGARPVFVDVDPGTWGMDKNGILKVLNKRTRAILSVHNYGEDAGDFKQFGLPVIEDSCEALGMVPIRGDMACFSFYGNKTITTGEGGMLCGDFRDARKWRDGGFDEDYRNEIPGLNYRMSNLQAALGLAQLERLDSLLAARLGVAKTYSENLKGKGKWLFVAEVRNPRLVKESLKAEGIESRPVFTPVHHSPAFKAYVKGKYKEADRIWMHGICLPTGPHITKEQQAKIIDIIQANKHL